MEFEAEAEEEVAVATAEATTSVKDNDEASPWTLNLWSCMMVTELGDMS